MQDMTTRELIYALMECDLDTDVDFSLLKDWKEDRPIKVYPYKGVTYIEVDLCKEYLQEK